VVPGVHPETAPVSTEAITTVSGRGVGMDVVRTNVEKIGGKVEIDSRPGKGTTLRLRIPLTLAIIPALIVRGLN
jgi:two-component system chemotaxis sensor kinase CheA